METIGEIDNVSAGPRFGRGGLGELALVLEIDLDRNAAHQNRLWTRHPGEERMAQKLVVGLQPGQVAAPGVAVSLGVQEAPIFVIDEAVEILVGNIVGLGVGNLAVARREVPEQPVVDRPHGHRTLGRVAAAQEDQFLLE